MRFMRGRVKFPVAVVSGKPKEDSVVCEWLFLRCRSCSGEGHQKEVSPTPFYFGRVFDWGGE